MPNIGDREYIDLSLNREKSVVLGDCQFLAYVIIKIKRIWSDDHISEKPGHSSSAVDIVSTLLKHIYLSINLVEPKHYNL